MKYYGNADYNRLEMVNFYSLDSIKDSNTPAGYLNQHDLLFDFIVNQQKERKGSVEYRECTQFKKKRYKKETYYIGIRKIMGISGECYVVWKQLPRIANDETFKWKYNSKYDTKETVINQGNFEFTCIVKSDGDAIVDVRYTKCENKHRNRVTITRIEVYNAANEEILKAIDEWKSVFKSEVNVNKKTVTDYRLVG